MYQKTDRLGGTFRVQRYKKYRIYANKYIKNDTIHTTKYACALPHYHTTT